MAITTVNQKFSLLTMMPWTASLPITPGTFGTDDKLQLIHLYPFATSVTVAKLRGIGRAIMRGIGRAF